MAEKSQTRKAWADGSDAGDMLDNWRRLSSRAETIRIPQFLRGTEVLLPLVGAVRLEPAVFLDPMGV